MSNLFVKFLTSLINSVIQFAYKYTNQKMMNDFNRSMPYADTILKNRWTRAQTLGFGEKTSIYDSALVFGKVKVGRETWIGPQVILDGSADDLTIGSHCSISAGVHIYTHDTVLWALSNGALNKRSGAVMIEDNCYLGSQSIILPGVKIGKMSIIAANSLINQDVPERTIWGGTPAKQIGYVEGEGKDLKLRYEHQ